MPQPQVGVEVFTASPPLLCAAHRAETPGHEGGRLMTHKDLPRKAER
jgi:hypothetical protein